MLDKMKHLLGLASAPSELTAALRVLKADESGRFEAVVGYVLSGASPEVVMAIESSPNLTRTLLRDPGRSWWNYWGKEIDKQVKKAAMGLTSQSANEAMEELFVKRLELTPQQWTRLGRVFAACSNADLTRTKDCVPAWLSVLLMVLTRFRSEQLTWPVEFVEQLLHADDAGTDSPQVILRCYIEGGTHGTQLLSITGVGEYATAHPDALSQAISQASLTGKLNALELIKTTQPLWAVSQEIVQDLAVSSSKQVREKALNTMTGYPAQLRFHILVQALYQGSPANIVGVVDHLARIAEGGHAVLKDYMATTSGKLVEVIQTALSRAQVAGDAPVIELVVPPCPPVDTTPLGAQFIDQLRMTCDAWVVRTEKNLEELKAKANPAAWQISRIRNTEEKLMLVKNLTKWQYDQVLDFLNGQHKRTELISKLVNNGVFNNVKGLNLPAAMRLAHYTYQQGPWINWHLLSQIVDTHCDYRLLLASLTLIGFPNPYEVIAARAFTWQAKNPELAWTLFAEQPERLEQALGIRPIQSKQYYSATADLATALTILNEFPVIPPQYVPRVAEIALGSAKTNRIAAQQLLERQPNGLAIACQGLSNPAAEVRSSAASWLARIGDPAAIPYLQTALKTEKREAVQAGLISALSRLGDDICEYLSHDALLAQAHKGLKVKPSPDMAWLPTLPAVKWANGQPVEPEIINWWARLSCKLKDPAGVGLIPIYVCLLDQASRQELGRFVLDAWIAQDTAAPSDDQARQFAEANAPQRYQSNQTYAKRYKGDYWTKLAAMTYDQVYEQARREKLSEYLGSAISSKGLLALTCGAPGHHVLQAVRRYIRDHGGRRAQVEALIIAAATNDDPAAIQLVLSVARRHNQATVQAKAQELAEQLAERKGWTSDQLADRTIPAAGFGNDRLLSLDYGPRQFVGRIGVNPKTSAWGIEVFTTEGKPVKALPPPASADDPELVKQAKSQLTVAKKELKQVVDIQSARLFEAMCLGRTWEVQDWCDDLATHPVMAYLICGLVWLENPGSPEQRLFRPTLEGELLDEDDESVELTACAQIGLAHASIITSDQCDKWRQHLTDYQVRPLFEQFSTITPTYDHTAMDIHDRRGWLSDSFAIRTRATKRGYTRAQAEDGAWFSEYLKVYTSAGITVSIQFTGSYLPEEQIPAAITNLIFERSARGSKIIPIADVPPILLAESYRDYLDIAEAGTFDPDWENKAEF